MTSRSLPEIRRPRRPSTSPPTQTVDQWNSVPSQVHRWRAGRWTSASAVRCRSTGRHGRDVLLAERSRRAPARGREGIVHRTGGREQGREDVDGERRPTADAMGAAEGHGHDRHACAQGEVGEPGRDRPQRVRCGGRSLLGEDHHGPARREHARHEVRVDTGAAGSGRDRDHPQAGQQPAAPRRPGHHRPVAHPGEPGGPGRPRGHQEEWVDPCAVRRHGDHASRAGTASDTIRELIHADHAHPPADRPAPRPDHAPEQPLEPALPPRRATEPGSKPLERHATGRARIVRLPHRLPNPQGAGADGLQHDGTGQRDGEAHRCVSRGRDAGRW